MISHALRKTRTQLGSSSSLDYRAGFTLLWFYTTFLPSCVYPVEVLHHLLGAKDELHVLASSKQAVKKSLRPHRGSKPASK